MIGILLDPPDRELTHERGRAGAGAAHALHALRRPWVANIVRTVTVYNIPALHILSGIAGLAAPLPLGALVGRQGEQ